MDIEKKLIGNKVRLEHNEVVAFGTGGDAQGTIFDGAGNMLRRWHPDKNIHGSIAMRVYPWQHGRQRAVDTLVASAFLQGFPVSEIGFSKPTQRIVSVK